MKPLFGEKDEWTDEGRQLDSETVEAIKPIIDEWVLCQTSILCNAESH
ncbi:hypothetical protein N9937_01485 [bacterium]|nr:hypothetical protein [bacterium]